MSALLFLSFGKSNFLRPSRNSVQSQKYSNFGFLTFKYAFKNYALDGSFKKYCPVSSVLPHLKDQKHFYAYPRTKIGFFKIHTLWKLWCFGENLNFGVAYISIFILKLVHILCLHTFKHGLRRPNEGINQRYLKKWADVADKICCRHT